MHHSTQHQLRILQRCIVNQLILFHLLPHRICILALDNGAVDIQHCSVIES